MRILLKDKNCWPIRAYPMDAGLDLKSAEDTFVLKPGDIKAVGTSVCVEIPNGYVGLLFIRSSVGTKTNHVTIANGTGVIDSWYRGEIIAVLHNNGSEEETIEKYSTFCQLVIVPCITPEVEVVDELSTTKRGINGFGSTTKLIETEIRDGLISNADITDKINNFGLPEVKTITPMPKVKPAKVSK